MFSPVAQAELANEQVHGSSKTKVHKLAACLGMFGAHQSSCMAQERMADGDFRTLPAAAWYCIHARFEAHAVQFFEKQPRRDFIAVGETFFLSCVRQAEVAPSKRSFSTDKEPMGANILFPVV